MLGNDIHEPESAAEYGVGLVNAIHKPETGADCIVLC